MEGLRITKEGKLIETYWEYDSEKEEGSYLEREREKITPALLHEFSCTLEEDVTLRSIFNLLSRETEYWDITIGNWCAEFIAGALKASGNPAKDLNYLELYKNYEVDEATVDDKYNCCFGYRWEFHAKGKPCEYGSDNYSLSFADISTLLDLPLKINEEISLWRNDEKTVLGFQRPTLFQIVYGIIWELSFHGGPEERIEKKKELEDAVKEIRETLLVDTEKVFHCDIRNIKI